MIKEIILPNFGVMHTSIIVIFKVYVYIFGILVLLFTLDIVRPRILYMMLALST